MKNRLTLMAVVLLFCSMAVAQAPERFNYQAIARDGAGAILANQNLGVRMNIRSNNSGGTIVYQETHTVTTNQFGLFTLAIGAGTVVSGTVAAIDWSSDSYFAQTEIDPAGGSSYTSVGAAQLLSVPYALYAKDGGPWKRNGANIHNTNTGNVGIGIKTPTAALHVVDSANTTLVTLKKGGKSSSPAEMLKIETDSIGSANDLISLGIPSSAPNTAQFIEFERGNNAVARINTNGDFVTDGEYQRTDVGDANLVPIAYGYINSAGTIDTDNSTGNFTVTKSATGTYLIDITGVTDHNNLTVVVTPKNTGVSTPDFVNYGSLTANLRVFTFTFTGGAFSAADDDFSFVAYQK